MSRPDTIDVEVVVRQIGHLKVEEDVLIVGPRVGLAALLGRNDEASVLVLVVEVVAAGQVALQGGVVEGLDVVHAVHVQTGVTGACLLEFAVLVAGREDEFTAMLPAQRGAHLVGWARADDLIVVATVLPHHDMHILRGIAHTQPTAIHRYGHLLVRSIAVNVGIGAHEEADGRCLFVHCKISGDGGARLVCFIVLHGDDEAIVARNKWSHIGTWQEEGVVVVEHTRIHTLRIAFNGQICIAGHHVFRIKEALVALEIGRNVLNAIGETSIIVAQVVKGNIQTLRTIQTKHGKGCGIVVHLHTEGM